MKWKKGITHAIAECMDCDWKAQDHRTAKALARKHAESHKHETRVEVGTMYWYYGERCKDD